MHLENYEGPFDLLLGLIAKHKLDVTEIAISKVTDEFVAYIRALGKEWDLGEVTVAGDGIVVVVSPIAVDGMDHHQVGVAQPRLTYRQVDGGLAPVGG